MLDEFQCVLLAGGVGDRLYPLTDVIPKALLPIANYPMIHYALTYLEQGAPALKQIIIVVTKKVAQQVNDYLNEQYKGVFSFVVEQVDDGTDSLDALRAVHKHIYVRIFKILHSNNRLILLS